jgi:hypothetical protein
MSVCRWHPLTRNLSSPRWQRAILVESVNILEQTFLLRCPSNQKEEV